jgi:hypothetical protein
MGTAKLSDVANLKSADAPLPMGSRIAPEHWSLTGGVARAATAFEVVVAMAVTSTMVDVVPVPRTKVVTDNARIAVFKYKRDWKIMVPILLVVSLVEGKVRLLLGSPRVTMDGASATKGNVCKRERETIAGYFLSEVHEYIRHANKITVHRLINTYQKKATRVERAVPSKQSHSRKI